VLWRNCSMLRSLSIQSKLILFLLLVALMTGLPIAYLGYRNGREAIEKRISFDWIDRLRSMEQFRHRTRGLAGTAGSPGAASEHRADQRPQQSSAASPA
ncbi:MAG: hypothetical protein ACKOJF_35750, partial [Planctomycetaceae bacterium]